MIEINGEKKDVASNCTNVSMKKTVSIFINAYLLRKKLQLHLQKDL